MCTDVLLWGISVLFLSLLGMGAVAFITLLERKVLGLSQYRMGPNKLTYLGLMQPVLDGVKLLSKDNFRPIKSQNRLFMITPVLLMFFFLLLWEFLIPWKGSVYVLKNGALVLFSSLAVMAYAVIMVGWSSTSNFSKMGSLRGILQSLSYEVALILAVIWAIFLNNSFAMNSFAERSLEMMIVWGVITFILFLMEGNRAPFDLLEGESELISGFNIEMGSLMFVYLFLSEYGMIMLLTAILVFVFFGSVNILPFLVLLGLTLTLRSCFPRVRYDSLMGLMWNSILPLSVFMVSVGVLMK